MNYQLFNPLHFFPLILLLLSVSSCQFGCPYRPPTVDAPVAWKTSYGEENQVTTPEAWKTDCHETNTPEDSEQTSNEIWSEPCLESMTNWWEIFEDPFLNQLENQALESNYSLWGALERVAQACAIAGVNGAARWPLITFTPSYSRSGMLIENPIVDAFGGNNGQQQQPNANVVQQRIPSLVRFINSAYTLPFNFSYEIDLWSRIYNTYYGSVLRAEAAKEAYLGVLLSLTTDIATNYFILRGLDTQQVILQKNIAIRQQALQISQARFQGGLVIYADVTRAEAELAAAQAQSIDIARQRALQENILAVLVGTPAPLFSLEPNPLFGSPPLIPTGFPSDLLYRRPDIAQAERNLAAAHTDIGVAYAAFYPSLQLTTTLGLESPRFASLFSWQARLWEVGANVVQTVFNAGRNSYNLSYYLSRYREALSNYEQQVLIAFKDVEDALINLKQQTSQEQALHVAVEAAQQTLALSQIRYTHGLANYLEVIDAERTVLADELNAALVFTQRYLSTVMLIKALGGGWGEMDSSNACAPVL